MQDYRKLIAWQRAHALTLAVHSTFAARRRIGIPGLSAQILRSAAAVAANIAEGCGRRTSAEFSRFLDIALGSVIELDYHLMLARDLGGVSPCRYESLAQSARDVRQLLIALIRRIRPVEGERSGSTQGR